MSECSVTRVAVTIEVKLTVDDARVTVDDVKVTVDDVISVVDNEVIFVGLMSVS